MSSRKIRVMVVDDSAVIRKMITDSVSAHADMEVVATAADGQQALEVLDAARPDVVTLDIQMPRMDGLAALDAILARKPVPVIMVSSLSKRGAEITLDALERGALDYLTKPDYGAGTKTVLHDDLPRKIRMVHGVDVAQVLRLRRENGRRQQDGTRPGGRSGAAGEPRIHSPVTGLHRPPGSAPTQDAEPGDPAVLAAMSRACVAIGISTGGPPALTAIFARLRPPLPPIFVVQHMPAQFTAAFAWRLNSCSALTIAEARSGDVIGPNQVAIAPGGRHMQVRRDGDRAMVLIRDDDPVSGHRPSADVLMQSAAEAFGRRCLGVIMTGMGHDGAAGCAAIRAAGGTVLGQDEASSDVYGMNKVAFTQGHVDRQFDLRDAADVITAAARRLAHS